MRAVLRAAVRFVLGGVIFGSLQAGSASALESTVVLVGDSVLSALNPRDTNFAQTVIGANHWNVKIDAKPCRCATTPGCKNGTPESVRNVLSARSDLASGALVIMVGHNDPRNESFRAKVDSVLSAAERSPMVFWVTMREVSPSYRVANRILAEEAAKRKNVRLVPWATVSGSHSDWFSKDGVHLRPTGARKLAETILRELDEWRSKAGGAKHAWRPPTAGVPGNLG